MSVQVINKSQEEVVNKTNNQQQTVTATSTPASTNASSSVGGSNFVGMSAVWEAAEFLKELGVNEAIINRGNIALKLAENQAMQKTTIQEYNKQSTLQWLDCGKSVLGGLTSIGTVALDQYNVGDLNEKFELQSKQLGELEGINNAAKNKLANLPSAAEVVVGENSPNIAQKSDRLIELENGQLLPNNKIDNMSANPSIQELTAQNRIKEEKMGGFFQSDEEWDNYFNSPEGQLHVEAKMNEIDMETGRSRSASIQAIEESNDRAAIQKVKDESDSQITNLLKKNDNVTTSLNVKRAQNKAIMDMVKATGDVGFDAAKASITKDIGEIKATNQAATFSNQTLQEVQQSLSQAEKQNQDAMLAALAALAQAGRA